MNMRKYLSKKYLIISFIISIFLLIISSSIVTHIDDPSSDCIKKQRTETFNSTSGAGICLPFPPIKHYGFPLRIGISDSSWESPIPSLDLIIYSFFLTLIRILINFLFYFISSYLLLSVANRQDNSRKDLEKK